MLSHLSIRNYIFVEKADITFSNGLNILTGETGAGKSIIIGALGLTFGKKSSPDLIKADCDQLTVTASFEIASISGVQNFLKNNDIENDDDLLILKRTVTTAGKSRCYINDVIVKQTTLKIVASLLIDIHSQHENHFLFKENNHQKYLDIFLNNTQLLKEYKSKYETFISLRQEIKNINNKEIKIIQEKEFLEFTIKELENSLISEEEYDSLTTKLNHDISKDKIQKTIGESDYLISSSILPSLENTIIKLESITKNSPKFSQLLNHLKEGATHLDDAKNIFGSLTDETSISESEIDEINSRLAKAQSLKKKYGLTLDDLNNKLSDAKEKLSFLENISFEKEQLQKKYKIAAELTVDIATQLHIIRKKGLSSFNKTVKQELDFLDMQSADLAVQLDVIENDEGVQIKYRKAILNQNGLDKITFIYSPAKESNYKKLKDIASGGEISRIMLALKTVLLKALPMHTMIFDEIDIGIGGSTAVKVGQKMEKLAEERQLIVITHLPQIAKYAETHFKIEKKESDAGKTLTTISRLGNKEKISEISRMISGKTNSDQDLNYAESYINN